VPPLKLKYAKPRLRPAAHDFAIGGQRTAVEINGADRSGVFTAQHDDAAVRSGAAVAVNGDSSRIDVERSRCHGIGIAENQAGAGPTITFPPLTFQFTGSGQLAEDRIRDDELLPLMVSVPPGKTKPCRFQPYCCRQSINRLSAVADVAIR